MYGLLVESVVDFIKTKYGASVWETVRKKAKIDNQVFSTHQQYSETLMQRIVKNLSEVTGQSVENLMDMLGVEFVNFVAQYGYDRILRVLGRHMRDFLNGLDNLHEYMRFSYAKLKPPSFFVEQESSTGLILHYRSRRKGFVHYVKGQIRQVGKVFYNIKIQIDILSEKLEMDLVHVVFQLRFENTQYQALTSSNATSDVYIQSIGSNLPIRSEIFFELFPFHVVFKRDLEIISVGESLKQAMKHAEGESIRDVFNLVRPLMNFNWDNIIGHTNNVFELTSIEPVRRPESPNASPSQATSIFQSSNDSPNNDSHTGYDECLKLRGQMMFIEEWDAIIFLATPALENLDVMFQTGFYINDLSMHDSSRDLVLVGTQQSAELKLALDQEKQKSKALEDSMKKLDVEMKRTDQLLYQMIPKKIADRLRSGEPVMNLCEVFSSCTILFSDVVGFTSTCSQLAPMEVVSMLNEMYTKFDKCLELHNVYKVETIGDAYMVVSGLPERNPNHAQEIIDMGFDMLAAISTLRNPATGETMMIRIGCHSGSCVAGVVGLKMPRYCLFGDAVNTASRMESTSEAMKIHISQNTKNFIEGLSYKIVERGKIEVKGKGEMKTYFVLSKLDKDGKTVKYPIMETFTERRQPEVERPKSQAKNVQASDEFDENQVSMNRGYSPILMDDVTKSKASLRESDTYSQKANKNNMLNNHDEIETIKEKKNPYSRNNNSNASDTKPVQVNKNINVNDQTPNNNNNKKSVKGFDTYNKTPSNMNETENLSTKTINNFGSITNESEFKQSNINKPVEVINRSNANIPVVNNSISKSSTTYNSKPQADMDSFFKNELKKPEFSYSISQTRSMETKSTTDGSVILKHRTGSPPNMRMNTLNDLNKDAYDHNKSITSYNYNNDNSNNSSSNGSLPMSTYNSSTQQIEKSNKTSSKSSTCHII